MGNYTLKYTGAEVDELLTRVEEGGGGGVSSWNDLTDKPFGETTTYSDTLTWDGDTSKVETIDPTGTGQMLLCRVSDVVPTSSDFANGAKLVFGNGNKLELTANEILPLGNGVLAEGNFNFVIVSNDNTTVTVPFMDMTLTVTFAKKGTYFGTTVGVSYVHSLTINGYQFKITEIKTIDPKFSPIMRVDLSDFTMNENKVLIDTIPYTPLYDHFLAGGVVEFVSNMHVANITSKLCMRAMSCHYMSTPEETGIAFVCMRNDVTELLSLEFTTP